jgi:hypothetical protein
MEIKKLIQEMVERDASDLFLRAGGNARVDLVSHAGGTVHDPGDIYAAILDSVKR